jgi:hypothetical protein
MLDHALPHLPFAFIALTLVLTIAAALVMRHSTVRR